MLRIAVAALAGGAAQADDVRDADCEDAWRRQVQAQAQAGDAAGGIATLTRLIALNPDGQYFMLRGRFEAGLGRAAAARADLDEGVPTPTR